MNESGMRYMYYIIIPQCGGVHTEGLFLYLYHSIHSVIYMLIKWNLILVKQGIKVPIASPFKSETKIIRKALIYRSTHPALKSYDLGYCSSQQRSVH